MAKDKNMNPFNVRVFEKTKTDLEDLAAKERVSLSLYVRRVLEDHVEVQRLIKERAAQKVKKLK